MSLEAYSIVFIIIIILGILFFLYTLVKDRIDIIRSIKPNNLKSFFGFYNGMNTADYFLSFFNNYKNPVLITLLNTFCLFLWVPFWILDKKFNLKIFED